jgi:hypothetical protein
MFKNAIDDLGDEERKVTLFTKFPDCFQTSEGQLEDFTQKYQTDMKIQHVKKCKIISFCMKELKEAELKAERDSIKLIEAYKKEEKHAYRDIEKTRDKDMEPEYDTIEKGLIDLQ